MKKILFFVILLSIFVAEKAYTYDKNFTEKIIYEFCDSYVNHYYDVDVDNYNFHKFDEKYFLKHMPKYENYGINVEETIDTFSKETINDAELNKNDVEYEKILTIYRKDKNTFENNNIFQYCYYKSVIASSMEYIKFYDLNLLGIQNNIRKDANEIKDLYTKIYTKYNENMDEYKYDDSEGCEESDYIYGNIKGGVLHMEVHYEKETHKVTHIDFLISS